MNMDCNKLIVDRLYPVTPWLQLSIEAANARHAVSITSQRAIINILKSNSAAKHGCRGRVCSSSSFQRVTDDIMKNNVFNSEKAFAAQSLMDDASC